MSSGNFALLDVKKQYYDKRDINNSIDTIVMSNNLFSRHDTQFQRKNYKSYVNFLW